MGACWTRRVTVGGALALASTLGITHTGFAAPAATSSAESPAPSAEVPETDGSATGAPQTAEQGSADPSTPQGTDSSSSAPAPSTTTQPAPACTETAPPAQQVASPGWPELMYDAPIRLWPFSTGSGVMVAVLSTGTADHPQLTDVRPGYDVVRGTSGATNDCTGEGTGYASIVAAEKRDGVGFHGLARDAVIDPIRVGASSATEASDGITAARLAAGILRAIADGAGVILIPHAVLGYDQALADAVAAAIDAGIVVVAAAGDLHPQQTPDRPTPDQMTPFPASLDGVIGVGAADPGGTRVPGSQVGPYVDLLAPGQDVLVATNSGHTYVTGTGAASAYVAASAALLLSQGTVGAGTDGRVFVDAVAAQIIGTAAPASGPLGRPAYGAGLLDPYRMLTEQLSHGPAGQTPGFTSQAVDPLAQAQAARDADDSARGLWMAWMVIAAAGAIGAVAWFVARAGRTGFRTLRDRPLAPAKEPHLVYVPGDRLFEVSVQEHLQQRRSRRPE
ncbi:S8 family serine peptidase [Blastococcus sp. Marseille-P5729]|uniref:S8 family serine peptidase n=1 Tax=Blastococcus sp. Marseille-P5729 TaxID=2086582 RepID=UPI00131B5996|nr:S8 family serine peptidase [Blastococcus sp. Marseille-P5729]